MVLYLALTYTRPLNNPDEGRYVEIPREMVASGNWITPHLNGVPYFYKPPLFYWLQAGAIKIGGTDWLVLRFWPAMLGALAAGMVFFAGSRLFDRRSGLWAGVCLGTCVLWGALSQVVILDIAVSVAIAGVLLCFMLAAHSEERRAQIGWYLLFYVFCAMAVMTKGLVGLAVPAVIVLLWLACTGRWQVIWEMMLVRGALLFLLLTAPWHILVSLQNPALPGAEGLWSQNPQGQSFFWFYFIHEHLLRYLTDISNRSQPFWFFFLILPAGFFPWVAFLLPALREAGRGGWQKLRSEHSRQLFLLIWAGFVLLFFSISKSKLVPYILPALPPLALLTGHWLAQATTQPQLLRRGLRFFEICAFILFAAFPVAWLIRPEKFNASAWVGIGAIMLAAACSWLVVNRSLAKGRERTGLFGVGLLAVALVLLFNPLATAMQRPSTLQSARFIQQQLPATTEVFVFHDYYQDLPVYLQRLVGVAGHLPMEQQPGLGRGDFSSRYIGIEQMELEFAAIERPVVFLLRSEHLPVLDSRLPNVPHNILFQDAHFTVLGNQALAADGVLTTQAP